MMRKMQNSKCQSYPDVKTAVVQIKRLVVGTKAVFAHTQLGRSWTMHCNGCYTCKIQAENIISHLSTTCSLQNFQNRQLKQMVQFQGQEFVQRYNLYICLKNVAFKNKHINKLICANALWRKGFWYFFIFVTENIWRYLYSKLDQYRKIYLTNIITLEILDQKCFTFNVTQYFHSHLHVTCKINNHADNYTFGKYCSKNHPYYTRS